MRPRGGDADGSTDGPDATVLHLPGRALLLVAGLPGSGKSTLLARLDAPPGVRVHDSAPVRAAITARLPAAVPYAAYRWAVHLAHRCGVVTRSFGAADVVVVHLPATRSRVRATVRLLARATRRRAHVLWLDVDPGTALDGQRRRRRTVRRRPFDRHVAHARRTRAALVGGTEPGWAAVHLLDRETAARGLRVRTVG